MSWTLVGGGSQLRLVRDKGLERAGAAEHLLRLPQRVFLAAEQRAGGGGVRPGGGDQGVVEEQEEDEADGGGEQRLGQRVDVEPVARVAAQAEGVHPTSRMSCSTALTCSVSLAISARSSVMLATASSASLR